MDEGRGCHHDYVDQGTAPFAGTDGARWCRHCEHVEVAIEGEWIDYDAYLQRRREGRPPPE